MTEECLNAIEHGIVPRLLGINLNAPKDVLRKEIDTLAEHLLAEVENLRKGRDGACED
jgi:hypothetical protein